MAMESLISLQCEGLRSIDEPTAPRPSGVQEGSVLVVLDVNKGVAPAAVYWTLGNVVRKGDHLKILGIITHIANPMGFMVRVDQSTWNSPNIKELQFEIATKKEAIWRMTFIKEWCEKAKVKLEVDVKAGNNLKVITSDEAKAMGACYVILDKNMKKDRKYFVDNLSCFVTRIRSSGGVDTLRSFAMSNKLPPMAPTTPRKAAAANNLHNLNHCEPGHHSKESLGSNSSYRGSSMSSTTFELGRESCDDFSAQEEANPIAISGTIPGVVPGLVIPGAIQGDIRGHSASNAAETPLPQQLTASTNPQLPNNLVNIVRTPDTNDSEPNIKTTSAGASTSAGTSNGNRLNWNCNPNSNGLNWSSTSNGNGLNWNSASNGSGLNWNGAPHGNGLHWQSALSGKGLNWSLSSEPLAPLTPRAEFRFEQGPLPRFQPGWIGQLNMAPEFGGKTSSLGRAALATSLQTQASFNSSRRKPSSLLVRAEKIAMDLHWPLMHWADCRAFKLRSQHHGSSAFMSSSNSSLSNFRGRRRAMGAGLNYSDMVDSD